jgi:hypothetical protein
VGIENNTLPDVSLTTPYKKMALYISIYYHCREEEEEKNE